MIKKQIATKVVAILLNLALLLPASIQFLHVFENHEHTACNEIAAHLHEKKLDCSIFDYNFSTFHFEIINYDETISIVSSLNQETGFKPLKHSSYHHHFLLRGPPTKA